MRTGLPDSVERISPLTSISWHPIESPVACDVQLQYRVDSLRSGTDRGIRIYRWNDTWEAQETSFDQVSESAYTSLTHPGIYAVYLDLTQAIPVNSEAANSTSQIGRRIEPNYPNPFRTNTTVSFTLDTASFVVIKVFDTTGRMVATPTNRTYPTGRHEVAFDGSGLSPGLYLYQIEMGNKVQSGTMVKVR